jgi:hypothetical protein
VNSEDEKHPARGAMFMVNDPLELFALPLGVLCLMVLANVGKDTVNKNES